MEIFFLITLYSISGISLYLWDTNRGISGSWLSEYWFIMVHIKNRNIYICSVHKMSVTCFNQEMKMPFSTHQRGGRIQDSTLRVNSECTFNRKRYVIQFLAGRKKRLTLYKIVYLHCYQTQLNTEHERFLLDQDLLLGAGPMVH